MRRVYTVLPRPFKKNLKALFILHPSTTVRALFFFFRPFLKKNFWRKLHYMHSVSEVRGSTRHRLLVHDAPRANSSSTSWALRSTCRRT